MALAGAAAVALAASAAQAAVTVHQGAAGFATFNAAAGNPPITIDFDNPALGDITGATLSGVTFTSPDGNTLNVVDASATFSPSGYGGPTNVLPATSGARVLSPGGPELVAGPDIRQRDSLTLTFADPLSAFGIDVLFQSLDGFSFVSYAVYDESLALLTSGNLNIPGPGGGGSHFMGFVSDSAPTNIGRIVFTEGDDNNVNPDSNIGFDTLRFGGAAIPEPATWGLMLLGFGLVGTSVRAARRRALLTA